MRKVGTTALRRGGSSELLDGTKSAFSLRQLAKPRELKFTCHVENLM